MTSGAAWGGMPSFLRSRFQLFLTQFSVRFMALAISTQRLPSCSQCWHKLRRS